MKKINQILFLLFLIASCDKDDEHSRIGKILLSNNYDCVDSIQVNVDGNVINLHEFFLIGEQIAIPIIQAKAPNYYCYCLNDCNRYNDYTRKLIHALDSLNASIVDSTMYTSCNTWLALDVVSFSCDTLIEEAYDYIIDNMHHAFDSLYISDEEMDLSINFITDVFYNLEELDFCEYVDNWKSVPKRNNSNGLFSGGLIAAVAAVIQGRLVLVDEPENDAAGLIYLLWGAVHAWGSAMNDIIDKGCEGLQDPGAGKMILSNMRRNTLNNT